MMTYERLLERVWGGEGRLRPIRAIISRLGDGVDCPTYVFNEPRVGHCVPEGRGKTLLPEDSSVLGKLHPAACWLKVHRPGEPEFFVSIG